MPLTTSSPFSSSVISNSRKQPDVEVDSNFCDSYPSPAQSAFAPSPLSELSIPKFPPLINSVGSTHMAHVVPQETMIIPHKEEDLLFDELLQFDDAHSVSSSSHSSNKPQANPFQPTTNSTSPIEDLWSFPLEEHPLFGEESSEWNEDLIDDEEEINQVPHSPYEYLHSSLPLFTAPLPQQAQTTKVTNEQTLPIRYYTKVPIPTYPAPKPPTKYVTEEQETNGEAEEAPPLLLSPMQESEEEDVYESEQNDDDDMYDTDNESLSSVSSIVSEPDPPDTEYIPEDFRCNICEKVFPHQSSLSAHSLIHANNNKFKCKSCSMGFDREIDFKKHVRSHTKKEFWCNQCFGGFTRLDALKRHTRKQSCGDFHVAEERYGKKARMRREEEAKKKS